MTTSLSNLDAQPRRDLGIPFTRKDQLTPPPSQAHRLVQQRVPAMMAYAVSEGRLFWLKTSEWSVLLVSVALCGFLTLLFLIAFTAGCNVRRSPSRGRSRAELRPPPRNNTGGVFAAGCPWGLGSPSFAPLGFFVSARATYRSKVAPRHPVGALGHFNVRHFLVVAHCERLLKTAFCADECLVLQIKSAVGSFDQLEPQFTAAFAAPRRWRRLSHGAHGISFRPICFGTRERGAQRGPD
jgi:hypothetical protein